VQREVRDKNSFNFWPIIFTFNTLTIPNRGYINIDKGMAVSVRKLRPCTIFDYKFVILAHNTIRGAAGDTILCAELMKAKGLLS